MATMGDSSEGVERNVAVRFDYDDSDEFTIIGECDQGAYTLRLSTLETDKLFTEITRFFGGSKK